MSIHGYSVVIRQCGRTSLVALILNFHKIMEHNRAYLQFDNLERGSDVQIAIYSKFLSELPCITLLEGHQFINLQDILLLQVQLSSLIFIWTMPHVALYTDVIRPV